MTDLERDKILQELDSERAKYEANVYQASIAAKQTEDRYAELLETISNQLASIEQLLREKLGKDDEQ